MILGFFPETGWEVLLWADAPASRENAPQAADSRQDKDRLVPAMVRWEGQYSDQLLETIDWCLCLNHLYRPQSVFSLQKALTEPVGKPKTPTSPASGKKKTWLNHVMGKFKGKAEPK